MVFALHTVLLLFLAAPVDATPAPKRSPPSPAGKVSAASPSPTPLPPKRRSCPTGWCYESPQRIETS